MPSPPMPRRGPSLSERSRASGIGQPAAWSPRHCWVEGHGAWPGRWPGVILEWRQQPDGGWQGRVSFVIVLGREVCLVESWLDAALLSST